VRPDWLANVAAAAGIESSGDFVSPDPLISALLSWRSMMPRPAHDQVSDLLLERGAQVWFLRSNQVGGWDPRIVPIAPTALFGQLPVLPTLLGRWAAAASWPAARHWWGGLGLLVLYGAIAIPVGRRGGLVRREFVPLRQVVPGAIALLVMPALVEEAVFRAALIPHPAESVTPGTWVLWAGLSTVLFVAYHPMNAAIAYRQGDPTFFSPVFLGLAGLLGAVCAIAYGWSGSLWLPVALHWVVVVVWLYGLGGSRLLSDRRGSPG